MGPHVVLVLVAGLVLVDAVKYLEASPEEQKWVASGSALGTSGYFQRAARAQHVHTAWESSGEEHQMPAYEGHYAAVGKEVDLVVPEVEYSSSGAAAAVVA